MNGISLTSGVSIVSSGALNTLSAGAYTLETNFDGLGATLLNTNTVRVFLNHEIGLGGGPAYQISNGAGGTIALTGARIDYIDLDRASMAIVDAGLAYRTIRDRTGAIVTSGAQLDIASGLGNFCSSSLHEANTFGASRGLADKCYFTGQELGGTAYMLDIANGELWSVPEFGMGAYENITQIDTGATTHVAFLLCSDRVGSPAYLYVGTKNPAGDFLDRNGLKSGQLYYWKADSGETLPSQFVSGSRDGAWLPIAVRDSAKAGQPGYDFLGYKTTSTLSAEALANGAFSFARPEDCTTNPANGTQAVFAATGGMAGDAAGNIYKLDFNFTQVNVPRASVRVLYDGDSDPLVALRNPDNLDWADDGYIYAQEDRATVNLFGAGAINPNEASVVRVNPLTGAVTRVAVMNRGAVPAGFVDALATTVGAWESSGILDVSSLFGQPGGSLFLSTIQAHGITNGPYSSGSQNRDAQLVAIRAPGATFGPAIEVDTLLSIENVVGSNLGDILVGDSNINVFNGGGGNDRVFGGAGADLLNGEAGDDLLYGEAGDDLLNGGASGADIAFYSVARSAAFITRNFNGTVTIAAGADGADTLTEMEWAQFTDAKVWVGAQRNDSNNDGRSDIIWQNTSGRPAVWQMNNSVVSASALLLDPGASWKLVAAGDFNGDRKADYLWQNLVDGSVAEWQMDGFSVASGSYLPNPGPAWHPISTGDFNGDGYCDIAWQHDDGSIAIWNMNGAVIVSAAVVANPGVAWRLEAAADFNADGTADLLFQHNDGRVATWQMNGASLVSGAVLTANPGTSWHIKGTGDFNRDGHADVVWQHDDGTVAVWSMQTDSTLLTSPTTGFIGNPGVAWRVGSVGDYNGDGVSDILLQNASTGEVTLWAMNGTNLTASSSVLAQNPGITWHMVG